MVSKADIAVVQAPEDSEMVPEVVIKMVAPLVVSVVLPEVDHQVQWYQS